ncbi:MAG: hypothetical protein R2879_02205 [Saprospiraceae bacterium]
MKIKLYLGCLLFLGLLIELPAQSTSEDFHLSKLEISLTPRFASLKTFAYKPGVEEYSVFGGQPRLQVGYKTWKNLYTHLLFDYAFQNSSDQEVLIDYEGYRFGTQLSWKFPENQLLNRTLSIKKRNFHLVFYPEVFASFGGSQVYYDLNSLMFNTGSDFFAFYEYGGIMNFCINQHFTLQLAFYLEYKPSEAYEPTFIVPGLIKFQFRFL